LSGIRERDREREEERKTGMGGGFLLSLGIYNSPTQPVSNN